jgi:hypothetical protein
MHPGHKHDLKSLTLECAQWLQPLHASFWVCCIAVTFQNNSLAELPLWTDDGVPGSNALVHSTIASATRGKFNEVAIESVMKRRRERPTNEPVSATKGKNPSSNQSGVSGVAVWNSVRPSRVFLGTSRKLQLSAIRCGLSSQRKIGTAR